MVTRFVWVVSKDRYHPACRSAVACVVSLSIYLPLEGASSLPMNYRLAGVVAASKVEVSPLANETSEKIKMVVCTKHEDLSVIIYCRDCCMLACAKCGLTLHSKHTSIEVEQANKEFRVTITKELDTIIQGATALKRDITNTG